MTLRFQQLLQFICLGLIVLSACKGPKAVAPVAQYSGDKATRVKEVSILNIPVELPASDIERQINAQIGNVIYEDKSLDDNGGDNLMLKVSKRAPIKLVPLNNSLSITVPVNIWCKVGYKVEQLGISLSKYEETEFAIDIKFGTKVGLDPNYVLTTATIGNGFNWIKKPTITLAGFQIPIDAIVDRIIKDQQPEIARIIDKEVKGQVNLKPMINQVWQTLQAPFLINDEYKVWLKLTPQELQMTPLAAKGNNLRTTIGLKAVTETVVGAEPKGTPVPLPNLKVVSNVPELFEIGLISKISFPEAKALAMKQLAGKVFEFQDGKRKISVTNIDMYGQGSQVICAIEMVGSLNAKVYLRGTPFFDAATNSIKFKDLDYDLDTRNKMAKVANWLFKGKFLEMMSPYFNVSIADQLAEARKQIQTNIAGNKVNDNVSIKGSLASLQPDNIYVTPEGMEAVIKASGKLEVLLSGF